LATLAAAAAADSAGAAPATTIATASIRAVVAATTTATPVEAAVAVIAVMVCVGVASPGIIAVAAGGLAGATADVACKPRHPPVRQRLSYTSEHGFTTFLAPLRARYEVRLPLPFKFVDTLGGTR
jgi:hypothetical protein